MKRIVCLTHDSAAKEAAAAAIYNAHNARNVVKGGNVAPGPIGPKGAGGTGMHETNIQLDFYDSDAVGVAAALRAGGVEVMELYNIW